VYTLDWQYPRSVHQQRLLVLLHKLRIRIPEQYKLHDGGVFYDVDSRNIYIMSGGRLIQVAQGSEGSSTTHSDGGAAVASK
jgi:hypothetical protein